MLCLFEKDFEKEMINHGWYSSVPTDSAVISICSTEDCIRGYIVANLIVVDDKHWFAKSTDNILNLDLMILYMTK